MRGSLSLALGAGVAGESDWLAAAGAPCRDDPSATTPAITMTIAAPSGQRQRWSNEDVTTRDRIAARAGTSVLGASTAPDGAPASASANPAAVGRRAGSRASARV